MATSISPSWIIFLERDWHGSRISKYSLHNLNHWNPGLVGDCCMLTDALFIPTSTSSALQTGNMEYSVPQVIFNLISRGSTLCRDAAWRVWACLTRDLSMKSCLVTASWSTNSLYWYSTKLGAGIELSHFCNSFILVSLLLSEKYQSPSKLLIFKPLLSWAERGPAKQIWALQNRSIHTSRGTKQSCFAGCLDFFDSKGIYGCHMKRNCLIHFEFHSDGRNLKLPLFLRGRGEQYDVYLLC